MDPRCRCDEMEIVIGSGDGGSLRLEMTETLRIGDKRTTHLSMVITNKRYQKQKNKWKRITDPLWFRKTAGRQAVRTNVSVKRDVTENE